MSAAAARVASRSAAPGRTARAVALAALLVYLLTGGGRIVGSDEVSMLQLAQAMLRGGIAVPEGATSRGRDGRDYTKNAAGQAVLALPLVALSEAAAAARGLDPRRRALATRFGASCFNALVTAAMLGAFYVFARRLGVASRRALAATVLLGFTTPVWVYAKSFMAEPLQGLGLLLALAGAAGLAPAAIGGLGVFAAVSAKLSMLPLALACSVPALGRPRRVAGTLAAGLVLAGIGHAIYDVARFGTPFETGYGAQATAAAYSTPLWVGLYGLLLSSGKGVLWFAPASWIALPHWLAGVRRPFGAMDAAARVRLGSALCAAVALLLYGRFQHWAGDGSFGPRYLVPVLPVAFLVVALALERGGRAVRRWAIALGLAGLLVQVGGVSIYFGAQMREAGDYPYRLPLDDPRFMSDSHFNPRFTPILGHWHMLIRNAGEHLRGEAPRLRLEAAERAPGPSPPGESSGRLGIDAGDQERLLHALDFWWTYLVYAGVPAPLAGGAAAALALLVAWAARRAWRAAAGENPAA